MTCLEFFCCRNCLRVGMELSKNPPTTPGCDLPKVEVWPHTSDSLRPGGNHSTSIHTNHSGFLNFLFFQPVVTSWCKIPWWLGTRVSALEEALWGPHGCSLRAGTGGLHRKPVLVCVPSPRDNEGPARLPLCDPMSIPFTWWTQDIWSRTRVVLPQDEQPDDGMWFTCCGLLEGGESTLKEASCPLLPRKKVSLHRIGFALSFLRSGRNLIYMECQSVEDIRMFSEGQSCLSFHCFSFLVSRNILAETQHLTVETVMLWSSVSSL